MRNLFSAFIPRKSLFAAFVAIAASGQYGIAKETSVQQSIKTLSPGILKVAVANTFPPVVMLNEKGELTGTDVEFLKRFGAENNLQVEFVTVPFDGIWRRPANNEVDIAANGISPLDSRKTKGMQFSEPYYRVRRTLIIRKKDAHKFRALQDFSGKKIGFVTGSIPEMDLKKRADKSVSLQGTNSFDEGVEKLKNGELDAIGEGDVTSDYFISRNPDFMVIDTHEYDPNKPEFLTFAVRDLGGALRSKLNNYILTREYPTGERKASVNRSKASNEAHALPMTEE